MTHFLISDIVNSGKSTSCMGLMRELVGMGVNVYGWLTPPFWDDGRKAGHDIAFIKKDTISDGTIFTRESPFPGSFQWRCFHFCIDAFKKAGESLAKGLDAPYLFVMDEIGPLELEDHLGFYDVFNKVMDTADTTLTVVRKTMVCRFTTIFDDYEFARYSLDEIQPLREAIIKNLHQ